MQQQRRSSALLAARRRRAVFDGDTSQSSAPASAEAPTGLTSLAESLSPSRNLARSDRDAAADAWRRRGGSREPDSGGSAEVPVAAARRAPEVPAADASAAMYEEELQGAIAVDAEDLSAEASAAQLTLSSASASSSAAAPPGPPSNDEAPSRPPRAAPARELGAAAPVAHENYKRSSSFTLTGAAAAALPIRLQRRGSVPLIKRSSFKADFPSELADMSSEEQKEFNKALEDLGTIVRSADFREERANIFDEYSAEINDDAELERRLVHSVMKEEFERRLEDMVARRLGRRRFKLVCRGIEVLAVSGRLPETLTASEATAEVKKRDRAAKGASSFCREDALRAGRGSVVGARWHPPPAEALQREREWVWNGAVASVA
eukprot:TRINITY_DN18126_c0_g1_i1.p1 TRINITY_DN18126_c0_g1~~TRINITY_DN18126_c0_g1_i1.p1  ORF type:complete len:378 (-),score=108.16 TRINITY_DN18126_c0_g1_i1:91-1224(-)